VVLRLDDRWIWDFWIARDAGTYHAFYLQAPRALGDPDLRHAHATVGHAVSSDLVRWEVLPDALGPGPPGSWDSMATWTGSIVRHEGAWWMFYTGAARVDGEVSQRIGAAVSHDLLTWEKQPGPRIAADERWYETLDDRAWFEEAWRDPWVFAGEDGVHHALITARANHGKPDGRGVVGHATSTDLTSWEVGPPLSATGEFGHIEVPQVVTTDDRTLFVFSCQGDRISSRRRSRLGAVPGDATYAVEVPHELGPFDVAAARPVLSEDLYSGRLVETFDGDWVWLGFTNVDARGAFVGELCDPVPFERP
jgi:beta-fructofuranosidase